VDRRSIVFSTPSFGCGTFCLSGIGGALVLSIADLLDAVAFEDGQKLGFGLDVRRERPVLAIPARMARHGSLLPR
jgi:hypothetical protein